jgi:Mrp family chromosome partitioning ATPase/capsular polysaccharide biosynthesis protein
MTPVESRTIEGESEHLLTTENPSADWDRVRPPGLLAPMARAWKLLVSLTVLAALTGAWASSTRPTMYESTAQLLLARPSETTLFRAASSSRDLERRVLDEVERIRSPRVINRAAAVLGDPWTPGRLSDSLAVGSAADRDFITVTTRASSAVEAARVANEVVAAYQQAVVQQARARADQIVDELATYLNDLATTAQQAQEQLDLRRIQIESELTDLPTQERIRVATLRLADDPAARELARLRDSALTEIADLRGAARRIQIDATLQGSGVDSFEPAEPPKRPVEPIPVRDGVLAAVLGLIVGAMIVLIRAERRPREVAGGDAARFLDTVVLAELPRLDPDERFVAVSSHNEGELDASYRDALTSVQHDLLAVDGQWVIVTAPTVSNGATTSALNLALQGVRDGHTVLLVDADLRGRGLTRLLRLDGALGWTDVMAGSVASDSVHEVLSSPDGATLRVIPAGTGGTGSEYPKARQAHALSQLLESFEDEVDFIVVDTSPLLAGPETPLLLRHADGVVVVIANRVATATVEAVQERLRTASSKLLGCLVFGTPESWRTRLAIFSRESPMHPAAQLERRTFNEAFSHERAPSASDAGQTATVRPRTTAAS